MKKLFCLKMDQSRAKKDTASSQKAIDRALELIDLTLDDQRWHKRTKEITRAREVLCDHFYGDNEYQSSTESLQRYFLVSP